MNTLGSVSVPVLVPVAWGVVSAVAALLKVVCPPNTIAYKISDKVAAVGMDFLKLFGMGGPTPPPAS